MRVFMKPTGEKMYRGVAYIAAPPIADEAVRIQSQNREVAIYLSKAEAMAIGDLAGMEMNRGHSNVVGELPHGETSPTLYPLGQSRDPELLRRQAAELLDRARLIEAQEDPQWGFEA